MTRMFLFCFFFDWLVMYNEKNGIWKIFLDSHVFSDAKNTNFSLKGDFGVKMHTRTKKKKNSFQDFKWFLILELFITHMQLTKMRFVLVNHTLKNYKLVQIKWHSEYQWTCNKRESKVAVNSSHLNYLLLKNKVSGDNAL